MTLQTSQSHRYHMEAPLQYPGFFRQVADILHVLTGFQIKLVETFSDDNHHHKQCPSGLFRVLAFNGVIPSLAE